MPGMESKTLIFESLSTEVLDNTQRIVRAVITTDDIDRYGTVILPSGLNYENYLKSGAPVLYNHNQSCIIGRCLRILPNEHNITADWQFVNASQVNNRGPMLSFIEDLWFLYSNGYLRGHSIGFLPDERTIEYDKNGVLIFKNAELVEFSLTPVPVNPNAITCSVDAAKCYARVAGSEHLSTYMKSWPQDAKERFQKIISTPDWDLPERGKTSVKVNERGVRFAQRLILNGKVDRDSSWEFTASDGNKLLGDDAWDAYAKWFLAVDTSENDDTKAHYKFPHGKNGKVYRRALIAAKQRASQQGYKSIYDAADRLLSLVDKDEKKEEKAAEAENMITSDELSADTEKTEAQAATSTIPAPIFTISDLMSAAIPVNENLKSTDMPDTNSKIALHENLEGSLSKMLRIFGAKAIILLDETISLALVKAIAKFQEETHLETEAALAQKQRELEEALQRLTAERAEKDQLAQHLERLTALILGGQHGKQHPNSSE